MKRITKQILVCSILLFTNLALSQTIFFEEDFETTVSPLPTFTLSTSFGDGSVSGATTIVEGAPGCGDLGRGIVTDFNSTNVDFKISQNSSKFMAINPEICGGYYNKGAITTTAINTSSATSPVKLRLKYYKTSTLGWSAGNHLAIIVSDGTTSSEFSSEFNVSDNWTEITLDLPTFSNPSNVSLEVRFFGGEGIGVDDIQVGYDFALSTDSFALSNTGIYPNPVKNNLNWKTDNNAKIKTVTIHAITGAIVKKIDINEGVTQVNVEDLTAGLYLINFKTDNHTINKKFIKQ
ncbi:T9SS type A sorting domain-containing protein [uncultured Lacinutrix sp.]|uniref:T9SS type A sorting domain-containing protein n=1 Tax=uncultured Lacinutrix sp. TaxID=574032 RepID=UPI002635C549|nr:T9SS type A sorting domain-containing protein [uncultured Lacinutrix sp.]